MTADRPNVIHANGDSTYAKHFGTLVAVTPMTLSSPGHRQAVVYVFRGGVHLELTPEDAARVVALTPVALAALPVIPNVSGALVDLGEPA